MDILTILGELPKSFWWMIIFLSAISIGLKTYYWFNINLNNYCMCGKKINRNSILCESCFNKNQDILPNNWSNTK